MLQWRSVGSLNTARWNFGAITLANGKVLAAGGFTGNFSGSTVTATCELYDTVAKTWALTGSMNLACANTALVLLPNNTILRFGGSIPSGTGSNTADIYDPNTGVWTATGTMQTAREIVGGVLLDSNRVLVIGGYNGSAMASCEIYDIGAGTWSNTGSLNTARYDVGYILLPNGKALAVGGFNNITTAEIYDPNSHTWSFTSNNPSAACGNDSINNLVTLPSGKILRTGGLFNGGTTTADCDLYDPNTDTWSAAASLPISRSGHLTTLLPSGKVIVAGGYTTEPNPIDVVNEYDPVGNIWNAIQGLPLAKTYSCGTIGPLVNNQVIFAGGLDSTTANSTTVILEDISMAISVVQSTSVVNTTGTTTVLTVTSTGAGNLLAITFVGEGSSVSQSIVSIIDNQLNSWALAPGTQVQSASFSDSEIWYVNNATAGVTSITVTITNTVGSGSCVIGFIEIHGQKTASVLESGVNTSGNGAPVGPAITTATNDSILLTTCFPLSTGATGVSAPWTAFAGSLEFNAYYLPGASGTYTAAFTPTTTQNYLSSGTSFLAAPSGPSNAQKASTLLIF